MLNKLTLICFSLTFYLMSYCQSEGSDSLKNRLLFIHDSLKKYPVEELKLLLNLEKAMNSHTYPHDSSYAFLLSRTGELYSKQGEFVKSVLQYKKAISIISDKAVKLNVNPDDLVKNYFRLYQSYDSLGRVSEMMEAIDSCISTASRRKILISFI